MKIRMQAFFSCQKERGEEGLMQMSTAQISPRIPDEKRALGADVLWDGLTE